MIECVCQHCGSKLRADESKAGKTAKCPRCGHPVQIPKAQPELDTVNCPNCGHVHPMPPGAKRPLFCRECGHDLESKDEGSGRTAKIVVLWALLLAVFGLGGFGLVKLDNFAVRLVTGVVLITLAVILVVMLNRLRSK